MTGGFSQLKAISRWRRKIARRGILAALMTTLLAGGCAYNGYYTDNWPYYPYYGGYYPYSYPYYGVAGGFLIRHGGHSGGHGGGHHGGHH